MGSTKSERSRVSRLATLGGELARHGLGYVDRDALRAVLSLKVADFCGSIDRHLDRRSISVGEAIAIIIGTEHGPMSDAGIGILHRSRALAYHDDCKRWAAQPDEVKNGRWRDCPPTRGQRMLMIRMAEQLQLPLPGAVTRGEAQAWIADHGGNPRYPRQEEE